MTSVQDLSFHGDANTGKYAHVELYRVKIKLLMAVSCLHLFREYLTLIVCVCTVILGADVNKETNADCYDDVFLRT